MIYGTCPNTQDGMKLVSWIYWLSGSCVFGWVHALSWSCGVISFCAWLGAQLPQAVENYLNESVEGLSWGFLGVWFIGDFTNFIGCILTHQLPFQTILAFYYVCIDIVLGTQYIYYSNKSERRALHLEDEDADLTLADQAMHQRAASFKPSNPYHRVVPNSANSSAPAHSEGIPIPNNTGRRANSFSIGSMITYSFLASFTRVNGLPLPTTTSNSGATATSTIVSTEGTSRLGVAFAWICAAMYLMSRIPQIIKNFKRKSTWGTTMVLFSSALTGNVTYTLSILLSPSARGPFRRIFLRNELPYLIGLAGTVCFDIIIIFQRFYYGNCRPHLYNRPPLAEPFGPVIQASAPQPQISSYRSLSPESPSSLVPLPRHAPSTIQANGQHITRDGSMHTGVESEATDSTPLSFSLQSSYSD